MIIFLIIVQVILATLLILSFRQEDVDEKVAEEMVEYFWKEEL
jgi:hypothetical protein